MAEGSIGYVLVAHKWKPTAPGSKFHHSHIQIIKPDTKEDLFHFGLFGDPDTDEAYIDGGYGAVSSRSGYKVSTSYDPNPKDVQPGDLEKAYLDAVSACGGTYHMRTNNCQKFARHFMTKLGATHKREAFHL